MERWTKDEFREFYRAMGEPSQEAFAEWLGTGVRSVQRWLNEPDKQPNIPTSRYLDAKLRQAVRERIGCLSIDFVNQMHRRDILRMLSGAASIPVGGASVAWDARPRVSGVALDGLEDVTTVLASKYVTRPAHTLLGAAAGHLEEVSGLLRNGVMKPTQRERLESIVADVALFVGVLSMQTGKMAQAGANLELAKRMARQADNMTLLAQALAEEALLDYYARSPETANNDPRPRIDLLKQAQALAKRHAPPIVQMAISGWLAEDKAVAKDGDDADEAMEQSQVALERAKLEGPSGAGFVSSVGVYSGYGEGKLEGFRGAVELALERPSAVSTFRTALQLKKDPRGKATTLTGLARALIGQKRPDEACDCLKRARIIGLTHGSAVILHHVLSARMVMPPEWNQLKCVKQLDDLLQSGWIATAPSTTSWEAAE